MAASSLVLQAAGKAPVLNSWKEIASYLGRGVRTVQRYERDLHLPVRRIGRRSRAAVVAVPEDLDRWLQQATMNESPAGPHLRTWASLDELHRSMDEGAMLRRRCHDLRTAHHLEIAQLHISLSSLVQEIQAVRSARAVTCGTA